MRGADGKGGASAIALFPATLLDGQTPAKVWLAGLAVQGDIVGACACTEASLLKTCRMGSSAGGSTAT